VVDVDDGIVVSKGVTESKVPKDISKIPSDGTGLVSPVKMRPRGVKPAPSAVPEILQDSQEDETPVAPLRHIEFSLKNVEPWNEATGITYVTLGRGLTVENVEKYLLGFAEKKFGPLHLVSKSRDQSIFSSADGRYSLTSTDRGGELKVEAHTDESPPNISDGSSPESQIDDSPPNRSEFKELKATVAVLENAVAQQKIILEQLMMLSQKLGPKK
jgi:hypothetical protein